MSVVTIHSARVSVLQLEMPGEAAMNAGILIEDRTTDRLYLRLRRDWALIAGADAEVLSTVEDDLAAKAHEMGAARLLEYLQDTLSNVLRISPPQDTIVEDFDLALARLYREHVHARVHQFVTHLPRYSLAAAAGRFLENQEVREEGWDEAPPSLRLSPEMFVAHVVGRSMEPRIPDGSLCVFRAGVTGSRRGRLVLVERLGETENSYSVKRYTSEKEKLADGPDDETWTNKGVRMESLNPEFEAWILNPEEDHFRIVAEFVQLLY
jgi:phage repressor protein C with HTH and peptisase S24 domain